MSTIVTRAGKGSPLTQAEVDQNFINLNTDKLDTSGLALGSAASPSLKFTGDTNTGLYSPGADQVAISTGGAERMRINSAGNVNVTTAALAQYFGINATGTAGSVANGLFAPTGNTLGFVTNATERARIDSSGRLLVGTSAVMSSFYGTQPSRLFISTGAGCQLIETVGTAHTFGSRIDLYKTRGASSGSAGIVQSNDEYGSFTFGGSDGVGPIPAAAIAAFVDGTPGTNDMPGRLVFGTTADGAATPTERMRIKSTGIVNIANTPTYADNAAATSGGLVAGDIYRKSDGTLMIRY